MSIRVKVNSLLFCFVFLVSPFLEPMNYLRGPFYNHYDLDEFIPVRFTNDIEDPNWLLKSLATISRNFLKSRDRNIREKEKEGIWMFNEQYIVKPPCYSLHYTSRSDFGWHQDSEYMIAESRDEVNRIPTVSCWIALDDMNLKNGTLGMQSYQHGDYISFENDTELARHHFDRRSEPIQQTSSPEFLELKAGSIVWISPFVWHCSASNRTPSYRRVYMPQFTSPPGISSLCENLRFTVEIKI
jgi:hypothetical protein